MFYRYDDQKIKLKDSQSYSHCIRIYLGEEEMVLNFLKDYGIEHSDLVRDNRGPMPHRYIMINDLGFDMIKLICREIHFPSADDYIVIRELFND